MPRCARAAARQGEQVLAKKRDVALNRRHDAADGLEQGGFAGAVRANDGDEAGLRRPTATRRSARAGRHTRRRGCGFQAWAAAQGVRRRRVRGREGGCSPSPCGRGLGEGARCRIWHSPLPPTPSRKGRGSTSRQHQSPCFRMSQLHLRILSRQELLAEIRLDHRAILHHVARQAGWPALRHGPAPRSDRRSASSRASCAR